MGNRKANGSRYNLKSRGLSMGSQYEGYYLINWTLARTFMVWNVRECHIDLLIGTLYPSVGDP